MITRCLKVTTPNIRFDKAILRSKAKYSAITHAQIKNIHNVAFLKHTKKYYSTDGIISNKYESFDDLDDNVFSILDSTNTEKLLDFENQLNKVSSALLLKHNGKDLSQDDVNKYWKDLILEYERSCNFYDSECDSMDLIMIRQYLNIGLRTNIFDLKYSDMLSKFIHLVTIVKAGTNRDFAIGLDDLKLKHDKEISKEINDKVEIRLIALFKEFVTFLEFVPLKKSCQDISVNFFYIIFLRLLNENEKTVLKDSKNSDIKLKLLNFFRSEMSKKKITLQPMTSDNSSLFRQVQINNFNSLSIDDNINVWDIESVRALQKCMTYRVIRTQDPEIISNFWDNFNFRSVFYKNNIVESWFVFIEQLELIFNKENVAMTPYMKNYIKNELLLTLEHDLISISEIKIKKGQLLVDKLKQFI